MKKQTGSVHLSLILFIIFLWTIMAGVLTTVANQYRTMNKIKMTAEAFHLAEAGITKALWELSRSDGTYQGERNTPLDIGAFSVSVSRSEGKVTLTATGTVGDRALVSIRAVANKAGGKYKIVSWRKLR